RHLHLRIERLDPPPRRDAPGRVVRPLRREDVPELTEVQNVAFTGSWGYCPNTPEQLDYRIYELPLDHPDDIIVVEEGGRMLGYCWAQRRGRGEPGVVGMVGVRPEVQGRGVGWAATAAALELLTEADARPITITVDEANTPAVSLYRALGFETAWRSVWYRLALTA
ncbi:MAG: GNAT family N-acetyltransferase, partial [Chloroflexota bacterium]|nr:GNAT family N-acetyltransferase [Chloroflexota bacterium]